MTQDNSPKETRRREKSAAEHAALHKDQKRPENTDESMEVGNEPVYPPETLGPDQRPSKREKKGRGPEDRAGLVNKPPGT
jgi:hypothetical protein